MTQTVKVRFESLHGHLVTYLAALSDLHAYLLPGWAPLWERDSDGTDTLSMLSPELTEAYRRVIREGNPR